jgi:hypothetical protein
MLQRFRAAVLPFAIVACADLAPDATASGDIATPTAGPTQPDTFHLVEEVRIGSVEGSETETFGRVGAIAAGRDGRIWVLDGQGPVIRMFDPDGCYVRDVGRQGSGPGEYRQVLGMQALHAGGVAIWDIGNNRITVYDEDGDYATSHRIGSGLFTADAFHVDTAGRFYVRASDADGSLSGVLIRVAATGEVIDSIALPREEEDSSPLVVYTSEGPLYPYTTATQFAWSPFGYLVTGRNDRYSIDLFADDPVRIERPHEPLPVSSGERDDWQALFDYRDRMMATKVNTSIPSVKPVFRAIEVGADGRIWVDRYVAGEEDPTRAEPREGGPPVRRYTERRTFDVFEPDGTFVGTTIVPPDTRIMERRGTHVWAVQRDELGVNYVLRLRMTQQ